MKKFSILATVVVEGVCEDDKEPVFLFENGSLQLFADDKMTVITKSRLIAMEEGDMDEVLQDKADEIVENLQGAQELFPKLVN